MLLLTVIGTVGLAGQAGAHTDLAVSDPADGGTLSAAPSAITLTFNEPVQDFEPLIALTGPDGQPYPTGTPIVDSTTVRSDVQAIGPAGTYTIAYRVVSIDGHPVTGQLQFELATVAVAEPAPPPAAPATPTTATPSAVASTPSTSPNPTTSAAPSTVGGGSTSPVDTSTAAPTGLAASSADGSSGPSGWVWAALVGAAVLIAAAGVVIVRQRRQQKLGEGTG